MLWIVVAVTTDPVRGQTVDAFGPWAPEVCDRERGRLLADFAYRRPWDSGRGRYHVSVVPLKDEKVAP